MKSRIWFFLIIFIFGVGCFWIYHHAQVNSQKLTELSQGSLDQLVISFTPIQDPDQLLTSAKPLIDYLQEHLKIPVKLKTVTDYHSSVMALAHHHIDVAFMPGLPAVLAMEMADCRPICIEVQRGKTYYYSNIYARKDSDINSLADLKGRSIAFTDPVSSSGFLYPLSKFYDEGLIPKGGDMSDFFGKVYWAGGYESALVAMYNGHVDASCGSEHAPSWYLDSDQQSEIKLIARAGPLPTHGIIVRQSLGDEFIQRLQQVFMGLNQLQYQAILHNLYHAQGLELADKSTYLDVLQKAQAIGLFEDLLPSETGVVAMNESS